jgi:hypothetical protein
MVRPSSKMSVAITIFITCFIFYLLFSSGHHYSIDGMAMFQYAKSLWFDHSFKMNPPIRWDEYEFAIPQWSIGLSLAYVPLLVFLSKTIFWGDTSIQKIPDPAGINYAHEMLHDRSYQYCSVLNPTTTALSAVILYLLCVELGLPNKRSCATALTFGLISPAAVYAKFDFAQPMASLLLLLTFFFLLKAGKNRSVLNLGIAGICMGLAILTRSEFMLFAPILALSVYFMPAGENSRNMRGHVTALRKLFAFGFPLCGMVTLNQSINFLKFGSWLHTGYPLAYYLIFSLKHWSTAFVGNLISPGKSIFLFCPVSILSLVGVRKLVTIDRWFGGTVLAFLVGTFLFYPIWRAWDGGLSWGPRYLIPTVPYLFLLAYLALPPVLTVQYRFVVGVLLTLGAIATLQGILFDFVDFYGSLGLSPAQIEQRLYHFSLFMSPLFSGWRGLVHLTSYDVKWLHLDSGANIKILFPMFGLFCLVALTKICLISFDRLANRFIK